LKHRFQIAVSKPESKPSNGSDRDPTQPPETQSFIGALPAGGSGVLFMDVTLAEDVSRTYSPS
jgi:hypothetical protein